MARIEVSLVFPVVFSVAQSLNPKFQKNQKFPKLLTAPKTFGNVGFPCVFLDFQQKSKTTHGNFWIFSRNPKKHMEIFGFSAEIQKKHGNFWIFSRNPKKHMEIFGFSAEIPKNTWTFLDFQQKSKKNTWKFLDFQQKSKKTFKISNSFWCAQ